MFLMQRLFEPRGPLVNSEYYPGWLDHWGEPHHTVDAQVAAGRGQLGVLAEGLDAILALNASVNMFMFHGGTSFGLTSGTATAGVAWVNRFCLGRYWPEVGPQVTLYVPWSILKRGQNELLLLELESAPCPAPLTCAATLQDKHVLDGPTPT
ncbi:Beta-galactosidase [Portunus trituberculatus]|uniref:Beta-galactosidase n=1 Tax=Portunus trituberculatus TaxID=210409 RepID=A0A5B7E588_PORTR|nr:Beta-galactosidase [Portunus trituberculatus]